MIRTYKRKLILTRAQESRLRSWIGAYRVVYNLALEVRIAHYKATGTNIHKYALMAQVPDLRKECAWIADLPSDSLCLAIEKLDKSFSRFYKTMKSGGGFPKFLSKKRGKSIAIKTIKVDGRFIILPKIGRLKTAKDEPIQGVPQRAYVIVEPTGLFVCVQCKDVPKKFESDSQAIGLDMGVSKFAVGSDGLCIDNPRHFKLYERRLRVENRSLSRKKKGSNSWKKQADRLSRLHFKIRNVRHDFLHKASTSIAKSNETVYLESLRVGDMAKNKKLSKHILDCGWSAFRTMLEYKTSVVRVNPKHTSQKCFSCGHTSPENRKTQSTFECVSCGYKDNADVNAAKNIKSQGMALDRERKVLA